MFILAVKCTPRMCNANRVRLSFGIARSNLARSGIARSDLVATHAYRLDWSLSLVLARSDLALRST